MRVRKGDRVLVDARYDLDLRLARKHVGGGYGDNEALFGRDLGGNDYKSLRVRS